MNLPNRKKKIIAVLSASLLFSIFLSLSLINFSTDTYKLSPVTDKELSPDFNTLFSLGAHYSFAKGYINFSLSLQNISYVYAVEPFNGLNPVVINSPNSPGDLVILDVWQLSSNGTRSSTPVPFSINMLTLVSPQGMSVGIHPSYSISCDSLLVIVNSNVGAFQVYNALGQYPGYHNFYFNFTLTIYKVLGPYKFPSQSRTVNLEYNNTIAVDS